MLKLKLQYFGHLMQRTASLEKTLMLGNIEGGKVAQEGGAIPISMADLLWMYGRNHHTIVN